MVQPLNSQNAMSGIFDEHEAELGQARMRLWMTLASIIYILFRWAASNMVIPFPGDRGLLIIALHPDIVHHLLLFFIGYGAVGLGFYLNVRRYPGHFASRRLFAMFCDIGALTYTMLVGGGPMMVFYALILWVEVGNGMRFGRRYLLIAAVLAQTALVALVSLSPFWQSRVDVIVTFSLTALVLPSYAVLLLRQTSAARDAAVSAMQSKSRFLAQASHDLRQPIHSIGYYLEVLRSERGLGERGRLIDRIDRALGSVSRLFNSLLDIARIDSGTIEITPEVIAVQPLLADIVQQNEQLAYWNNVELRLMPTLVKIRADPTLLATMVQNLLSNAIKYGRNGTVLLGVRRLGNSIAIEIYDQGIGIDADHLPHIFEEFYRGHVAGDRDTEGVGLGLAIVDRLTRLCGFRLEIRSRHNVGTCARIANIPISVDKAEAAPLYRNENLSPLAGFRVILIEDDQDVLGATRTMLERWGCIVQAHSALPLHFDAADVIVADFDLGQRQIGTDAIKVVRVELGWQVPAILMTGHSEAFIGDRAKEVAAMLLAKPVQPAMLRSALSTIRSGNLA